MPYVSFSLKYRPKRFDDLIGQQHVAKTLKNALANDRVAHAYLFTGPRGTGKTSTARILAAALNCEKGPTPEPCGECDMCKAIIAGSAMDTIEMDAASNRGIDDIRDLREKVKFAPAEGRYKIYILDEAHQLTPEANNALLKTLEEPPDHVVFMLLTTEANKIIPTILSRCQHFEFRAITLADIVGSLRIIADQEQVEADDAALRAIAHAADGAMRDGQSIFDQVVAFAGGPINLEVVNQVLGVTDRDLLSRITDAIISGDVAACFASVDQAISEGKDLVRLAEDLTIYLRDLLRLQIAGDAAEGLRMSAEATEQMQTQAEALGEDRLLNAVKTLAELQSHLKDSSQHALLVEVGLAQLSRPPQLAQPSGRPSQQQPSARPTQAKAKPAAPPEPPAAHPVVAEGQELSLPLIAQAWDQVRDELNRMGHMPLTSAILREDEGRPVEYEGDTVTLGFTSELPHNRIDEKYKSLVEEAASSVFGRKLSIECRLFDDPDEFKRQVEAARTGSAPPASEPGPAADEPAAQTQEPESPTPVEPQQAATQDAPEADEQAPMTPEQAVEQTLSLFAGSEEVTDQQEPNQ